MHIPHFVEAGRVNPTTAFDRMPEEAYATALDYLVFTCVDIALMQGDRLLLARRNRYPRKTWWIIGGRMIAGESPLETAQRKALEETKLENLAPKRFRFVGAYSTCFAYREQSPMTHGSHSVNLTYCIEITATEASRLILNEEYEPDYCWVPLDQVKAWVNPDNSLDQALIKIVEDLQILQAD